MHPLPSVYDTMDDLAYLGRLSEIVQSLSCTHQLSLAFCVCMLLQYCLRCMLSKYSLLQYWGPQQMILYVRHCVLLLMLPYRWVKQIYRLVHLVLFQTQIAKTDKCLQQVAWPLIRLLQYTQEVISYFDHRRWTWRRVGGHRDGGGDGGGDAIIESIAGFASSSCFKIQDHPKSSCSSTSTETMNCLTNKEVSDTDTRVSDTDTHTCWPTYLHIHTLNASHYWEEEEDNFNHSRMRRKLNSLSRVAGAVLGRTALRKSSRPADTIAGHRCFVKQTLSIYSRRATARTDHHHRPYPDDFLGSWWMRSTQI